uniref:Ulp1 protease family, C-terminal catalytic domain-containing protein n=1 Tax=Tanacetum cinerariifolium TaxID=118510 RepID=A0A6L2MGI7_TANCI|nr:ulp1 protease family, C-terminal catalytic domain-containing protein [Tanacetum cinerariifolium]
MDILAEHAARKTAKLEVVVSGVEGYMGDYVLGSNWLTFCPILRSAKHALPLANPKPKAPKLKPSDVTESDQEDGSGKVGEKKRKKDSEPSSSEDKKTLKKKTKGKGKGPRVVHVTAEKVHEILGLPIGGISLYDLPERREDDEFVQLWLSQFAPKKKKRIFATDITKKLVRSTRVDFMFKVNFLMLFVNVMGKADTMRAFVNLSVVRVFAKTQILLELTGVISFTAEYPLVSNLIVFQSFAQDLLSRTEIICEIIKEKLSSISKEKAEVETLLRDANKEFSNDDNVKQLFELYEGFFKETVLLKEEKAHKAPQNVKPKSAAVKTKEAAEKPKPVENVKELAEKPKEPVEKAQEAPQNVKPKPAAVKTKEATKNPMPAENVKELAEKPKEPAEKAHKAPQNVKPKPAAVKTKKVAEKPMPAENVKELAEEPKEPAGGDYHVVPAAVMKVKGHELHDWPRVVEPVNMVQPSTPKRVFSSPNKEYVKPVKTINTPYMCRRIDVTARCKRIECVLGNSLFPMEGDKYETVFQSLGGYRELSLVRVNMETLAPTLCIDANVIDCWVALLNFE